MPEQVTEAPFAACYAMARTRRNDQVPDLLLMAVVGDGPSGDIWKIPVRANTLSEPAPFESQGKSSDANVCGALAISEQGYLATVEPKSADESHCSLVFRNPITAAVVMRVSTELSNVVGLAYHPTSRNLYAIASASDSTEWGVFRIEAAVDAGSLASRAVRVAKVDRPAGLAFGPDGVLYVTAWHEAAGPNRGVLLRIKGEL
jgi:glucose/arabinose dehydrogenase